MDSPARRLPLGDGVGASVLLVSATQALSARLPEVVDGHGHRIRVLGTLHGHLLGSPFIDGYEALCLIPGDLAATVEASPSLIDRGADWVLFDDDALIRRLAESDLPLKVKQRVLPASTDVGLAMLGSKLGQQRAAEAAGVPTPRTVVVGTPTEVTEAMARIDTCTLFKADVGGGGAQVWRLRHPGDLSAIPFLEEHLPALVAEEVRGPLVSAEALYRRGRLLGFVYSHTLRALGGGRGPSTVRRYLDPPTDDVRDSLERIGAVSGAHGFANVTFIWCPRRQQHLLIECDLRINACVQYGPQLGVVWGLLLGRKAPDGVATTALGPAGRVIHVHPRELSAALSQLSWSHLAPWVRREPGTWDARNHRDPVVNAVERKSIYGWRALVRSASHDQLRSAWNRLPPPARAELERRGWKRSALAAMDIRI